MKLSSKDIIIIFLISTLMVLSISGFEPNIFLGWYDELASFLSWARTTELGDVYNNQFSGGTFLSEGVYRTPAILFIAVKQNHFIRQITLILIRIIWIFILLSQIYKNWYETKYKNLALLVSSIILLSDYATWGYFYGGLGIKYFIVTGVLLLNNNEFKLKKYREIFILSLISILGLLTLTAIEYEGIFALEVLIVCLISRFSFKKLKFKIDQQLIFSCIFCLLILLSIILTMPSNNEGIYIRDTLFNFREHTFILPLIEENRNIWSNFYLRFSICFLSLNLLNIRNSYKYIFVALLPIITTITIYFIQEIIYFFGINSKLLIYRSNYHFIDILMIGITYIGLIPLDLDKSETVKLDLKKYFQYTVKLIFLITLFIPIFNSLLTRSKNENKWIKESRPLIKNALKNNTCKYFAIRTDTLGKLFLYYDENLKSFSGFKPYNSERKYTFIKGLLNKKFDYPYQHLHLFGDLKDYELKWFNLTGVCGLIDNNYNIYNINSKNHISLLEKNIIISRSTKETLNLMKEFKDEVIKHKKVVIEAKESFLNSKTIKYDKKPIKISEFNGPKSRKILFSNEYQDSFIGICQNANGEISLGKVYSANLINTVVFCKRIPNKVSLIIYQ